MSTNARPTAVGSSRSVPAPTALEASRTVSEPRRPIHPSPNAGPTVLESSRPVFHPRPVSEPRRPISPSPRPSKKQRLRLPAQEVIELFGSDEEEPKQEESDDIKMFDSNEEEKEEDEEEEEEEEASGADAANAPVRPPGYIYNTNDLLRTRQPAARNWLSGDVHAWTFSREDFHSEQVDYDRSLPANLSDRASSYVSRLRFCFYISFA